MDDLDDLNLHCTVSVDISNIPVRAQELCDRGGGGRPGRPELTPYGLCGRT